jgi:hypothetical protein
MRNRFVLALFPAALVAAAWACSSTPASPAAGNDGGGLEAGEAGDDADADMDPEAAFLPDVISDACTLEDGSDPVALCMQQQMIGFELANAYTSGQGVAPGWSSASPYAPLTGHSWQDDLGLAGALGAYLCGAEVYGNNQTTGAFTAKLTDIGNVLFAELQQSPPSGYDGEIYFRLRWAQAAYNYIEDSRAATMGTIASTYGAALASQAYPVAAGGGDAGSPGGVVIGTKNADGTVSYAPAQTVMAAAALLDMAVSGATSPDAGPTQAWVNTAQQVLTYVLARGRDPVTGLFYQSLVTSGDPGHDTVGPGTPTNDSMLTDTQAWITLALARAQDLLDTYQALPEEDGGLVGSTDGSLPPLPAYWGASNDLAAALTNAGLFDGTSSPPPPPATPPVGAYMEGLILSGSQMLTNKTTIGNAIFLGGLHRVAAGGGAPLSYELGEIRSALLQIKPESSSLFTIVTNDPSGNQESYLRAGSRTFGYAVTITPGSDSAPVPEQGAMNYRSDAMHAMIEGITQLWVGASHTAVCAP